METTSVDSSSAKTPALQAPETTQDKTTTQAPNITSGSTAVSDEFGKLMKKALGESASEVSEEELFAAIIQERLQKENAEAATFYESQVATLKGAMARWDGKVSMEDVGKEALKATVAAGKINQEQAELINAKAFAAAQLDDDASSLFDAYGGADDPTVAVASMEDAMARIKLAIDAIDSGKTEIAPMSLDTPSNSKSGSFVGIDSRLSIGSGGDITDPSLMNLGGAAPSGPQSLDGSEGFLWKPEAEKDGKLVVILPQTFTGMVTDVEIHRELPATDETKIEAGKYSGVGNNGREHFRFSQSGGAYGDNIYLVTRNADGTTASWQIPDGGARND